MQPPPSSQRSAPQAGGQPAPRPGPGLPAIASVACLVVASVPIVFFALVRLPLRTHVVLSIGLMAAGLWVSRRLPTWRIVVAVLSVSASLRYIAWRGTTTLALDRPLDAALSIALFAAEIYGVVVLVAGYFQTAMIFPRRPVPLPADGRRLPNVDVMVPTYNESVDIVRRTLVGATCLDYPRFRVHLLDDGKRPEMRQLARELGVRYVARATNRGAKAGNINNALGITNGDLVAIFDADHVPVRSFLRVTVGFFLDNPRMGLVQTPHHFYNPDPFERNLWVEGDIATEQSAFYHLVQIGNDFWNSAFFCGSCAVLRRSALVEVGGIAEETVTEDAHTALRMHAAGWDSAYFDVPQAAGLATERYAAHVSQRIRWARGMTQIFRLDNPMFKKGLSFAQRVNYLNAIQHFQFGFPRLIFFFAPVAYVLFDIHPLDANAWEVVVYAGPHIFLSVVGGVAMSRSARHAFWAEVFETAIAPYTAAATFMALIAPRKGAFNVTAKGYQQSRISFDWRHALPNMLLLALVIAATATIPARWRELPLEHGTLTVVALWNLFNIGILFAAVAVAIEAPQRRKTFRVTRKLRVRAQPVEGETWAPWVGETVDVSEGGARIVAPPGASWGEEILLDIDSDTASARALRCRVVLTRGCELRLAFTELSSRQRNSVIELMFTAPESWVAPPVPGDHPLTSLWTVLLAPWVALRWAWHFAVSDPRASK